MLGFLRRRKAARQMTAVTRGESRERWIPGGRIHVQHGSAVTMILAPVDAGQPRRMVGLLLAGLEIERERPILDGDEVLWGEWGQGRYTASVEIRRVSGAATPARARQLFPQSLPGSGTVEERADRIIERAVGDYLHQRIYFGAENLCFVLHTAGPTPIAHDIRNFRTLASNISVAVHEAA
jgi:hypothetical protein